MRLLYVGATTLAISLLLGGCLRQVVQCPPGELERGLYKLAGKVELLHEMGMFHNRYYQDFKRKFPNALKRARKIDAAKCGEVNDHGEEPEAIEDEAAEPGPGAREQERRPGQEGWRQTQEEG